MMSSSNASLPSKKKPGRGFLRPEVLQLSPLFVIVAAALIAATEKSLEGKGDKTEV
jgi:hypothetical protein